MKIKTKNLLMRIENRSTNTLYFDSTIEKKKKIKAHKIFTTDLISIKKDQTEQLSHPQSPTLPYSLIHIYV